MSDKKDDKKKISEEDLRSYTGTKTPSDEEFARWIARQWRLGEKLEKIDVIEYFAKGQTKGWGQIVDFEIFANREIVNQEEANDLCNRFHGSAQINCDRIHKKEMTYYARAFDKGRQDIATPVDTFPLFLRPKTVYVLGKPDDEEATAQSVSLDYLRTGIAAHQWDRQREDTNVGDYIAQLMAERREERQWVVKLQEMLRTTTLDWITAIHGREAALSQEMDRLPQRELTKIKAEMLRDGFRAGKNILTGLIGGAGSDKSNGNGNGNGNGTSLARMTQERMLIDNFFNDCKNAKKENGESAQLDLKLFGEWEKNEDGSPKLVKKGIFTPEQFAILARVHGGHSPAESLDDLLPGSGHALAITMEQLGAAQALDGMTEGIAVSLVQLVKIRTQKRETQKQEARTTTAEATPAADSPSTPKKEDEEYV